MFVEALLKGDGVVYGASKVLYAWPSGEATVQEIYGQQSAPGVVSVKIWLDGSLVEDQNVVNTAASEGNVNPLGMDWGALNRCLAAIGINWAVLAVISVACGWACALTAGLGCLYCLSAATGWTGGSIAGCMYRSWR